MRPCFQSLDHVYGHQSHICKIGQKPLKKLLKLRFFNVSKNGFHHLDPIFMPFSKWGITFLYYKNWPSYKAICKFSVILDGFCKNGSGDHIHGPNFENRASFFPQGTKLSVQNVFIGFWFE